VLASRAFFARKFNVSDPAALDLLDEAHAVR
jgi:hypothetical protein